MRKLLLLSAVLMASCQLVVDIDVPYDGDKAVVNAVQTTDSVWQVNLSRTKYILDAWTPFFPIDYADVVVHKPDGTSEALISKGNGEFRGVSYPEPGKAYKITVEPNGLDAVEGEMIMPQLVKIINVEWDSTHIEDPDVGCGICMQANVPFKITFSDPPDERNYYDVNVYVYAITKYRRPPSGEEVIDTVASFVPAYIRDPAIASENDSQSEFSDEAFAGKTYTIPMIAQLRVWGDSEYYKTEVWLTTKSEDYYKYDRTSELSRSVQGDPFAQPVQIFSNMSNGFGIFAGMASDIKTFH